MVFTVKSLNEMCRIAKRASLGGKEEVTLQFQVSLWTLVEYSQFMEKNLFVGFVFSDLLLTFYPFVVPIYSMKPMTLCEKKKKKNLSITARTTNLSKD